MARAWQLANERPFFYASAGKGAIPAAWKQAAWAELAATALGLHYAAVLLGIVKARERIPYWCCWSSRPGSTVTTWWCLDCHSLLTDLSVLSGSMAFSRA